MVSEDEELGHIMSAPRGDSDLGEAPGGSAPGKNGDSVDICICGEHDKRLEEGDKRLEEAKSALGMKRKRLRTLWRNWWAALQREVAVRKRLEEAERALAELMKAHRQEVCRTADHLCNSRIFDISNTTTKYDGHLTWDGKL